jgi:Methyltransferase FkbM domain
MGAFWSFYSMWFQKEIQQAVNYMIEPDSFNLGQGKRNFKLNKMKGTFIQAFVGKESSIGQPVGTLCIDDFVNDKAIPFIHMLHSDIQGYEYEMLLGAEKTFEAKKIGYVFISTHSNELHYQCLEFLNRKGFYIIASVDIDETYSEDGLIAARAPYFEGIEKINISRRSISQ